MTEAGYDTADSRRPGAPARRRRASRRRRSRRDGIDRSGARRSRSPGAKSKALGDSPNPFFNVWRSYCEPGGIADEMRATAAANPDVMKLEQIGTSTLGKPILAIKMTADARNVPDGARPALLFSADQPRA